MSSVEHALDIVVRAIWEVYLKRLILFRSLIYHVCILTVSSFVLHHKLLPGAWLMLAALPVFYSYIQIGVTTHRIILLNSEDLPRWGKFRFTSRELRFFLMGFGIGILCIPASFLLTIPVAGIPLAFLATAYIAGRFSLVLPAAAIDANWTFQRAWNNSKAHQLTMGIIVFVFPFIVGLPETWISYIPYSTALVYVISIFTTIFTIAALSLAFHDIQGRVKIESEPNL